LEKLAEIQMQMIDVWIPIVDHNLVDFAALHATFRRHQAAPRETETGVAEPAATARLTAQKQKESNEIEVQMVS
jgi:hypothetical protein